VQVRLPMGAVRMNRIALFLATVLGSRTRLTTAVSAAPGAPGPAVAHPIPLTPTDPGAVCINGVSAHAFLWTPPTPSTQWVLQLGPPNGGAGLFCFEGLGVPDSVAATQFWSCQFQANPPAAPLPPPPPPMPLPGGILDNNCTRNPTFCTANKVIIDACDYSMFMGTGIVEYNGTKLTFAGDTILQATVKMLQARADLAGATDVILTGVTHAATAVVLKADAIGEMLRAAAPKLAKFRALPADGMHPQFRSFFDMSMPGLTDVWFDHALGAMANISNAIHTIDSKCAARQLPNETYKCLYAAQTLPHLNTPVFAVQQMPGVWDYQCAFDGRLRPYLECSSHSTYFRGQYMCVQYPDLCAPPYVANYSVPLQQRYVAEAIAAGLASSSGPGHGGFYFGCYLGSYWEMLFDASMVQPPPPGIEPRPLDSVWNQIAINGVTMRQAIDAWWDDRDATPAWHQDSFWNPSGTPPLVDQVAHPGYSVDAPPVPAYTSRFFTNPTCRGYPWY